MPQNQNPVLAQWLGPMGCRLWSRRRRSLPPRVRTGAGEHRAEIDRIAQTRRRRISTTPSPLSKIRAPVAAGRRGVLESCGTDSTPELEEIEREISGVLARHASETSMNAALFARIDALYARRGTLGLTREQLRVLELIHKDFMRAGARLEGAQRARMTAIVERLARLGAAFSQNVLAMNPLSCCCSMKTRSTGSRRAFAPPRPPSLLSAAPAANMASRSRVPRSSRFCKGRRGEICARWPSALGRRGARTAERRTIAPSSLKS